MTPRCTRRDSRHDRSRYFLRQQVSREKMLARPKYLGRAVLQPNLHLALQDEHPLRVAADMELAPEAHRAFAQLQAMGRQQGAQAGFFCTLI